MNNVITALDFKGQEEALAFLQKFPEPIFVKIGMELFYAAGPDCVKRIISLGHKVFLDLKFHDIPNTVAGAVRSCANLGAEIINLHAAGGTEMMKYAVDALKSTDSKSKLIAITQLTSTSEAGLHQELLIAENMETTVLHYAGLAKKSGLDGVVCSALEVEQIHKILGRDFLTVTPGIRPLTAAVGDQKRVVTPGQARDFGADYIVVGRPITEASDPLSAYQSIVREFTNKL